METVTAGIKNENGSYLNLGDVTASRKFRFDMYDVVTDLETGTTGQVTSIYQQGFEFTIYSQKWFVYRMLENPIKILRLSGPTPYFRIRTFCTGTLTTPDTIDRKAAWAGSKTKWDVSTVRLSRMSTRF